MLESVLCDPIFKEPLCVFLVVLKDQDTERQETVPEGMLKMRVHLSAGSVHVCVCVGMCGYVHKCERVV